MALLLVAVVTTLLTVLIHSLIPPMIAHLARVLVDQGSRGFKGIEIVQCLGILLFIGIVCSFGFFAVYRWIA